MSESNEPSYYEIALTGRQVTTAFVLLLTSLLVAFFSGVWIGRGSPHGAGTALAEVVAPPKPAPNELSFFAEPAPPPAAVPAPAPVAPVQVVPTGENPSTTLAQDLSLPAAPAAPAAAVENPAPAPVEPPRESAGERQPSPPANPPPAATAPAPSGPLVIQVFTSSNEAKAKDMWQKLKAKGFKAYLSPTKTNGKTVYRVRVGPFQKEADAKVVDERIRKQFKVTTWITRSS